MCNVRIDINPCEIHHLLFIVYLCHYVTNIGHKVTVLTNHYSHSKNKYLFMYINNSVYLLFI